MTVLSDSLKDVSEEHTAAEIHLINGNIGITHIVTIYRDAYLDGNNKRFIKKIRAEIKKIEGAMRTKSEFRIKIPEFNVRLYQ